MPDLINQTQFVDSPEFHSDGAESILESNVPELDRFFTADEERILFRRMNYLKFKIHQTTNPELATDLFHEALGIRNRIVIANLPFAKSLVANWKHTNDEHKRDDQFSLAYLTLIRCVELFDYQFGFAFLAYAGPAIRSKLGWFDRQLRRRSAWLSVSSGSGREYITNIPSPELDLSFADDVRFVRRLMQQLPDGDREFMFDRFGLDDRDPVSRIEMAQRKQVCRQRISQIEKRIMNRLRQLAGAET